MFCGSVGSVLLDLYGWTSTFYVIGEWLHSWHVCFIDTLVQRFLAFLAAIQNDCLEIAQQPTHSNSYLCKTFNNNDEFIYNTLFIQCLN